MKTSLLFGVLAGMMASQSLAAPRPGGATLPLYGADLKEAEQILGNEEKVAAFANYIYNLPVFADHRNPRNDEIDRLESKSVTKTYYVLPYFKLPEHSAAGDEFYADRALKVMDSISEAIDLIGYSVNYVSLLEKKKARTEARIVALEAQLGSSSPGFDKNFLRETLTNYQNELKRIEEELLTLSRLVDERSEAASERLFDDIKVKVIANAGLLGVHPNTSELNSLGSTEREQVAAAIGTLADRAANNASYGVLNAQFESATSETEREFIRVYRQVRPDVQFAVLIPNTVSVKPTAMTSASFQGELAEGANLYRGVNLGSDGRCGSSRTCLVSLEYSFWSASSASRSKYGQTTIPVIFEGKTDVVQPAFDGSISCDYRLEYSVQGRADVIDGGIIYDGDIRDRVDTAFDDRGKCRLEIREGSRESAHYHYLQELFGKQVQLKTTRAEYYRNQKDEFRENLTRRLEDLSAESIENRRRSGGTLYQLTSWVSAFGLGWGTVASFISTGANNFFYHTRYYDYTDSDTVNFSVEISERNVTAETALTFNGKNIACWGRNGGFGEEASYFLKACGSLLDTAAESDTREGRAETLCRGLDQETCSQVVDNLPEDEDGNVSDRRDGGGSDLEDLFE